MVCGSIAVTVLQVEQEGLGAPPGGSVSDQFSCLLESSPEGGGVFTPLTEADIDLGAKGRSLYGIPCGKGSVCLFNKGNQIVIPVSSHF